jgi:Tfp pilus assembly protein PilF
VEKDCVEIIRREEVSVHSLLDAIDLFGELPAEVHQRLLNQTQQWLAEEPDLFIAYLLHATAAIRAGKFQAPLENLRKMEMQVGALSSEERALRSKSLERFETVAWAVIGLGYFEQKQYAEASKYLKRAITREPASIEYWMLRGRIGMAHKGLTDANEYFRRAIDAKPRDPRVYRYYLQALLPRKEASRDVLQKLLSDLVARATDIDDRSWLTAAQVSLRLDAPAEALDYLSRITDPLLKEDCDELRVAIAQQSAPPADEFQVPANIPVP